MQRRGGYLSLLLPPPPLPWIDPAEKPRAKAHACPLPVTADAESARNGFAAIVDVGSDGLSVRRGMEVVKAEKERAFLFVVCSWPALEAAGGGG